MNDSVTKAQGVIVEALPSACFKVRLDDGREMIGHLAGKLRLYRIRIMPGDQVAVEISKYDTDKCRITYRMKK